MTIVALLAACSSKSNDKPPPAPPEPVRDAAMPDAALDLSKPCLPPSMASANVAYLRSDGPRVTVCYGNGDDSPGSVTHCLVLDEVGEVVGPRTWEDASKARLEERTLKQPRVTIEEDPDEGIERAYIANFDQTRAFGFVDGEGVFFDLRTNKRIGTLGSLGDAMPGRSIGARWVGAKHVLVADCGEDQLGIEVPMSASGCQAWLASTGGDTMALTTPDKPALYQILDDDLVAVITGKQIALVDVSPLRQVATLLAKGESSPVGDVRIARFSDQLVVAHARPAGIFFVDRASNLPTTTRAIPICP